MQKSKPPKPTGSELPPVEEMWMTIEGFGIKRDVLELQNPSIQEIRNLYKMIKERQNSD